MLIDELGIEPGPELHAMEQAVLSHDPSLDPPGVATRQPRLAVAAVPSGTVRFVGRASELGQLALDLDEALTGRLRIALLAGEPGVGKTRLAEEVAGNAQHRGMAVAWGRCYQGRGAPAFWPWTQIIRDLITDVGHEQVAEALGDTTALARIVPDLRAVGIDDDAGVREDPESEKFRVCESLSRLLVRLAGRRPLLVVLEDLQWADAGSLQALSFLAGELVDVPLLVIGTHRNVGVPSAGALVDTLAELARRPVVRRLDLAGLDPVAVRDLLAASGAVPGDDLVRALHRRTQGNPFFLVEIMRLRTDDGHIDVSSVPSGVRNVIRQRTALLPHDAVEAMAAASVLGVDFEVRTLVDVVGRDTTSLLRQLEPAFAAGLLLAGTPSPGRCRFSHGLVRDTLYDDLGVAARPALHERAANALESTYGLTDGPHLLALADHRFRAVPAGPADKGIDVSLRAARWASTASPTNRRASCSKRRSSSSPRSPMDDSAPNWSWRSSTS